MLPTLNLSVNPSGAIVRPVELGQTEQFEIDQEDEGAESCLLRRPRSPIRRQSGGTSGSLRRHEGIDPVRGGVMSDLAPI
jgi:hypothetical protein